MHAPSCALILPHPPCPVNPLDKSFEVCDKGPAVVRAQQGDQFGFSPPAVNIGAHLFGGVEKDITDRLSAFLEAKYLNSAVTPRDEQGSIRGNFSELAGVAGLSYKFGGGR